MFACKVIRVTIGFVIDDEVVLESVPFKGTIMLLGEGGGVKIKARGFVSNQTRRDHVVLGKLVRGVEVSMRGVTSGTLVISIGEKIVTLSQDCEQVEFDGHRARLEGGAKRVVFARDGTVEVSDLK